MPTLAGTLEKRKHWRKEWTSRFFVMGKGKIDYFLTPPAILDAEHPENLRGSIPLDHASAVEEPGREYCIRMGNELFSCATHAEQQRWIEAINTSAVVLARRRASSVDSQCIVEEPQLLLFPPDEPPRSLKWHEQSEVLFSGKQSFATVLFLDGITTKSDGASLGGSFPESSAQTVCQLPLFDAKSAESSFPVQVLGGGNSSTEQSHLHICVHANKLYSPEEQQRLLSPIGCLCVALALLVAGNVVPGAFAVFVAILLLLWEGRVPPRLKQHQVTFSVERFERGKTATPNGAVFAGPQPLWVGSWTLDKTCSEPYEPILADMGVNYFLRKAADAIKSGLIISVSATDVTIHVKTLVTVEDCIPLDGSWAWKDVPPGGRMKGQMRVKVTKFNERELEMYSEFPNDEGNLRDTLTMSEDGNSFTRIVVRGELSTARVFRKNRA